MISWSRDYLFTNDLVKPKSGKLVSDYEIVTSYYIPLLLWQISWNSWKTLPEKHKISNTE